MTGPGLGLPVPSRRSKLLAEAVGTFLLVGIGTGAIVAGVRFGGVAQWVLAVAWFAAVTVPVLLFAGRSGADLNPVVTVALAMVVDFPGAMLLLYVVAQFVGAFSGSLLVWWLLGDYGHLGATVPNGGPLVGAFVGEFLFTMLLVIVVLHIPPGLSGLSWWLLLPGLAVGASTLVIGPVSGSSLNPARTIAPAVLTGTFTDLWLYLTAVPLGGLSALPLVAYIERVCARRVVRRRAVG